MSLLGLVLTLVVIGILVWGVNTYVPTAAKILKIINVVVVVVVVIWLLQLSGLLSFLARIQQSTHSIGERTSCAT